MKVEPNSPAAKLAMMKESMRCLVFGVLALLPIIGVPFALMALWSSCVASRRERQLWNPGRRHRIAGLLCPSFGALVWSVFDTILIYHAVSHFADT